MTGVNMAVLVGNVGQDPEIRDTSNGRVAGFSLATSESWRDRATGEKHERTEWHRIVVFGSGDSGGLTKVVEDYVRKGSKLFVRGQIRTRKWQGQDGIDRYSTEIVLSGFGAELVLLDRAGGGKPPTPDGEESYGGTNRYAEAKSGGEERPRSFSDDMDDEIPF